MGKSGFEHTSPSDLGIFRDSSGNPSGRVNRNAIPSSEVVFSPATQQQVLDAIRNEDIFSTPPAIDLAKRGLFDPNDVDAIFHPKNTQLLAKLGGSGVDTRKTSTGTVTVVNSDTLTKIINILTTQPSRIRV